MVSEAAKKMTPILDCKFRKLSSRHRLPASAGFTLLELLLVLTILAMAVVLVVPNLSGLETRTFSAQTRKAASLLNYARRISVISGQPSTASFLVAEDGTTPSADSRITSVVQWQSQGITLRFRDSTDREIEIDERIDIVFYPEGGSTGGTLILAQNQQLANIEIDPFTGRITTEFIEE